MCVCWGWRVEKGGGVGELGEAGQRRLRCIKFLSNQR